MDGPVGDSLIKIRLEVTFILAGPASEDPTVFNSGLEFFGLQFLPSVCGPHLTILAHLKEVLHVFNVELHMFFVGIVDLLVKRLVLHADGVIDGVGNLLTELLIEEFTGILIDCGSVQIF